MKKLALFAGNQLIHEYGNHTCLAMGNLPWAVYVGIAQHRVIQPVLMAVKIQEIL